MPSRILSSLLCSQRSERREQRQTKTKFSSLAMPSRILSSLLCSQRSERREQRQTKTKFSSLAMPSRLLSSLRQKQSSANEGRSKTFVLIMPSAANLRCHAAKSPFLFLTIQAAVAYKSSTVRYNLNLFVR